MSISNEGRAERAEAAMAHYEEGGATGLVDLLSDLRHWAAQNGEDFAAALRMAEMHFEAETDDGDDEDDLCGICHDPRCDGCTPDDTPSLDTAAHDHEMHS